MSMTDYTIDPRELGKTTYAVKVSRLVWQDAIIEVDAYDEDDAIDTANYVISSDTIKWDNDEIIKVEYDTEMT